MKSWWRNDLTDDGNVSFLLSKHTVDYFILGEFHWNICISKFYKDVGQFCTPHSGLNRGFVPQGTNTVKNYKKGQSFVWEMN